MTSLRTTSLALAAAGSTALALSLLGVPSIASPSRVVPAAAGRGPLAAQGDARTSGYDARQLSGPALAHADRAAAVSEPRSVAAYYRSLGSRAVVQMDPLTHTVRDLGRTDGFLTRRSTASARSVALGYVRSHLADLGLSRPDLSTLRFRQDYVDVAGIHHLSWSQVADGIVVYSNGLRANVTRDGRLISVQGSPVSGLSHLAAAASATPRLGPSAARHRAATDVHSTPEKVRVTSSRSGDRARTEWANGDSSAKVWFLTPAGLRLGWATYVQTARGGYQHVIDARTGSVLLRSSLTDDAAGDAFVYDYYPGAHHGGKAHVVNLIKRGWLGRHATFLDGTSVVAFSDVNDDNRIQSSEKTPVPGTRHGAQFKLKRFTSRDSRFCSTWFCTWDPATHGSWKRNRSADTTNAFYLASKYHDYLAQRPIGFTRRAGNFTASGGDPVRLNTLDGAATGPDPSHIDNANMTTPPDGHSPTMQMYLWHFPGVHDNSDPFVPASGAFDASILLHEYTHGLSGRLVVDPEGNEALNSIQSGSMGEAWSDYYALDYLVSHGLITDTATSGQVLEGRYVAAGLHSIRTMAIDCPVGATSAGCTSGANGHKGGYTYDQFSTILAPGFKGPEVHASGEIWGQTLWDIRRALGHTVADSLITRAMSLSPTDPSFLDMRNAILQADQVVYKGSHTAQLWKVFAKRGMGYFAATVDGSDAHPVADFHRPPDPSTTRTSISGTVTDADGPVSGALVRIAGSSDQFHDLTNGAGHYTITGVFPAVYPEVVASADGHLPTSASVDATSSSPADFTITRDWAASTGGAAIASFTGPDFTPDCGPVDAIDTTEGRGWGSIAGTGPRIRPVSTFTPKYIVVDLQQPIDITRFEVDPTSTCGDAGSSSTGAYKIQTSTTGATFSTVATGTFVAANQGKLNAVVPSGSLTGIHYVKLWIMGDQVPNFSQNCPNGPYDGCTFADLTELAVIGEPSP